ncbi:hypothetical protein [Latilactobacillus sakei]|uniref:hypothetical protein n=1 Tax=Latilactobacillus sakei TaxID=1599 RepID=UPI001F4C2890|nr:hypothetical protein [Latilactobacillus sakei]
MGTSTLSRFQLWRSDAASAPPSQQKRMRVHAESLGKLLIDCISAPLPASQDAGASRTNAASTESQQQQQ